MSQSELLTLIATVLADHGREISLQDLELEIAKKRVRADTFSIQRAIRQLVKEHRAELTPRFAVRRLTEAI